MRAGKLTSWWCMNKGQLGNIELDEIEMIKNEHGEDEVTPLSDGEEAKATCWSSVSA